MNSCRGSCPHAVAAGPGGGRHGHRRGDPGAHRRRGRLGRHHQRPQGTAGPPARRGGWFRDPVPAARPWRDPQDPRTTRTPSSRCAGAARSRRTRTSCCPSCRPATTTPMSTAFATGCAPSISGRREPMLVAVGATYDATIADTNNLHRRVIMICVFAIGAATVFGWLLAAFAVRPFKRLAHQTRSIDAGDETTADRSAGRHRGRRDRRRRQRHAATDLE